MIADVLSFRISRRGLGVAAISGEEVLFTDTRHLAAVSGQAVDAAARYGLGLVERFKPRLIAVYAPTTADGVTRAVTNRLKDTLRPVVGDVLIVEKRSLLGAFGINPLKDRRQLQSTVLDIWPKYEEQTSGLRTYIADAFAAALFIETEAGLATPT